jgi:hypothetical protein
VSGQEIRGRRFIFFTAKTEQSRLFRRMFAHQA